MQKGGNKGYALCSVNAPPPAEFHLPFGKTQMHEEDRGAKQHFTILYCQESNQITMAKELAREIIALSKGGSKLAFKISPDQSANLSDPSSSVILSPHAVATDKYSYSGYDTQNTTFRIHFIRRGESFKVIYSGLKTTCDFITSVLGDGWIRVQLVLYKNNMSECIELSNKYARCSPSSLSLHIKDNLHLLDVIDVVEG